MFRHALMEMGYDSPDLQWGYLLIFICEDVHSLRLSSLTSEFVCIRKIHVLVTNKSMGIR